MVTSFKVNVGLLSDAVVDYGLNPIWFTNRGTAPSLQSGKSHAISSSVANASTFEALSIPVVATPAALREDNPGLL